MKKEKERQRGSLAAPRLANELPKDNPHLSGKRKERGDRKRRDRGE